MIASREKAAATLHFNNADYVRSLEELNRAIRHCPDDPELYAQRANVNIKLERFADAIDDCDTCLQTKPQHAKALKWRKEAMENQRALEEKRAAARETYDLDKLE